MGANHANAHLGAQNRAAILDALGRYPQRTSELTEALNLHKNTVLKHLRLLADEGRIARDEKKRWYPDTPQIARAMRPSAEPTESPPALSRVQLAQRLVELEEEAEKLEGEREAILAQLNEA